MITGEYESDKCVLLTRVSFFLLQNNLLFHMFCHWRFAFRMRIIETLRNFLQILVQIYAKSRCSLCVCVCVNSITTVSPQNAWQRWKEIYLLTSCARHSASLIAVSLYQSNADLSKLSIWLHCVHKIRLMTQFPFFLVKFWVALFIFGVLFGVSFAWLVLLCSLGAGLIWQYSWLTFVRTLSKLKRNFYLRRIGIANKHTFSYLISAAIGVKKKYFVGCLYT